MTLRLAHLSDIHFGGEHREAVAGAAAWIARHKPDLAIITGDITREGEEREFAAARSWINRLAVESVVVPGNHDTAVFRRGAAHVRAVGALRTAFRRAVRGRVPSPGRPSRGSARPAASSCGPTGREGHLRSSGQGRDPVAGPHRPAR